MSLSLTKTTSYLEFPKADCILEAADKSKLGCIKAVKDILEKLGLASYIQPNKTSSELRISLGPSELQDVALLEPQLSRYIYDKSHDTCFSCDSSYQNKISRNGLKGKFFSDNSHQTLKPLIQPLAMEARSFYRRIGKVEPVKCTLSPDALASEKLMLEEIYEKQDFQGLCVGEYHNQASGKKFLIDHMETLKKLGVTTLFFEPLNYQTFQPLLDEYFSSASDTMPKLLSAHLQRLDNKWGMKSPHTYTDLIRAAKKAGIRVVGIETRTSYEIAASVNDKVNPARIESMNYVALKIMQNELRDGKFIAFTGCYHASAMQSYKGRVVPGLSNLMQCPALLVKDSKDKNRHIYTNSKRYNDGYATLKDVQIWLTKPV